jgi:hypothetical protein
VELYAVRERRGGPWDWGRGLREQVRERLAADPWLRDGTLSIVSIERWTILLDGWRVA